MHRDRIVVVGASLAGVRAAEEARRRTPTASIVLIGAESHFPPIDRPQFSKAFLTTDDPASVSRLRVSDALDATVMLGHRAVALDRASRLVTLDDGIQVPYDGLVIATGASVRRLPWLSHERRVHVLRTFDDALGLRADLASTRELAVIGAGVLGSEIAATARSAGIEVALIDVFGGPMLRVLGPTASELITDLHDRHGVRMHFGQGVARLLSTPGLSGVELEDGTVISADTVVIAVGAAPETGWLDGSGLTLSDGVVCDEFCFADGSERRVVAAGDVARWRNLSIADLTRVEHWTNAASQGQVAAANLVAALAGATDPVPYCSLPYFWSDQYGWKFQFVGIVGPEVDYEIGAPGEEKAVISFRDGGRLVGALCINTAGQLPTWRRRVMDEVA